MSTKLGAIHGSLARSSANMLKDTKYPRNQSTYALIQKAEATLAANITAERHGCCFNSSCMRNTVLHQGYHMLDASFLSELYWYTCVVDLGSYSAAAEKAGVGKSSLSRRVVALEERLGVQLLSRNTRRLTMTSAGEDIYRHALNMLAEAHAAHISAEENRGTCSGLVRIAVPSILSDWLIGILSRFQKDNPNVRYELFIEEGLANPSRHLDLCLSLLPPPEDSAELVVRKLVNLQRGIVISPTLAGRLGANSCLKSIPDNQLLAYGTSLNLQSWVLKDSTRTLQTPSLITTNLQALKDAAKAGLGAAYLPLAACQHELQSQSLQLVCTSEQTTAIHLNMLTPSFRGITFTTRSLIEVIRKSAMLHVPVCETPPISRCNSTLV